MTCNNQPTAGTPKAASGAMFMPSGVGKTSHGVVWLTLASGRRVDATFDVERRLLKVACNGKVKATQLGGVGDESGMLWLAEDLLRSLIAEAA